MRVFFSKQTLLTFLDECSLLGYYQKLEAFSKRIPRKNDTSMFLYFAVKNRALAIKYRLAGNTQFASMSEDQFQQYFQWC